MEKNLINTIAMISLIYSCQTRNSSVKNTERLNSQQHSNLSHDKKCLETADYFSQISAQASSPEKAKQKISEDIQMAAGEFYHELLFDKSNKGLLKNITRAGNNFGFDKLLEDESVQKYLPKENLSLTAEEVEAHIGVDSSLAQFAHSESAVNKGLALFWTFTLTQALFFNEGAQSSADGRWDQNDVDHKPLLHFDVALLGNPEILCAESPIQIATVSAGGSRTQGGIALFKGRIFPDQWYVQRKGEQTTSFSKQVSFHAATNNPRVQMASAELILTQQPYMELEVDDLTKQTGAAAASPWSMKLGASEKIINILFQSQSIDSPLWGESETAPSVNFFRGVKPDFDEVNEVQAAAKSIAESSLADSRMSNFGPYFSEFSSPNYFTALGWAGKGSVIHFLATRRTFDAKVTAKDLGKPFGSQTPTDITIPLHYAGIEFQTPEVAFLYDESFFAQRLATRNAAGSLIYDNIEAPTHAATILKRAETARKQFPVIYQNYGERSQKLYRSPFCRAAATPPTDLPEVGFSITFYLDGSQDDICPHDRNSIEAHTKLAAILNNSYTLDERKARLDALKQPSLNDNPHAPPESDMGSGSPAK